MHGIGVGSIGRIGGSRKVKCPRRVRKVHAVNARSDTIPTRPNMKNASQFAHRRQVPVSGTAHSNRIDRRSVIRRVALIAVARKGTATGVRSDAARHAAVGRGVGGVPAVGVGAAAQPAGGLHLPHEPGHVVFGAGPVGGAHTERSAGGQHAAVVGDFCKVESRTPRANLGKPTRSGRRVSTIAAVLPRVYTVVTTHQSAARNARVACVIAKGLAGVVHASRHCA